MKRILLMIVAASTMVGVTALALSHNDPLLLISWAGKASPVEEPVAILIEMGVKDVKARDWSGKATVQGAKLVRRESYRFRSGDKLTDDGRWVVSSHRAIRAPKGNPAISKMEPIASVGVVLHLTDIQEGASLNIEWADAESAKESVALMDVRAGKVKTLWNGEAVVRRLTTSTPLVVEKTEDDFPAAAYGRDGARWVAYISYTVKEDRRRIEAPMLKAQPDNFKAYCTPGFGEQLFVQYLKKGKWSKPIAVTQPEQDLARCAIGVDGGGQVWVVYSAHRNGKFNLYGREIARPSELGEIDVSNKPEVRITTNSGPDLGPVMCTDQKGDLWLACQSWQEGQAKIAVFRKSKQGPWKNQAVLAGNKGENCWHPALAADNTGKVALAYDIYRNGDYDVDVAIFDQGTTKPKVYPVAASARAEMRPSLAYQGDKLWIAYEEGPEKWGKDYGALAPPGGNPLYSERSVRVLQVLSDGTLKKPQAELPTSKLTLPRLPHDAFKTQKFEQARRYAYPHLGIDLKGNLWLAYRQSFSSRYSSHPGSYWITFVRRLEEKSWSDPIEVHHSDGLLDHRPVLLPDPSGGLWLVHNTDGRYTTPEVIDNQIYTSVIDLPGEGSTSQVQARHTASRAVSPEAAAERAAVERIRSYRIRQGEKTYRILRGEFHRHTEMSWDGGADGSLEDMFRYAIDAAGMDWIANGDHDNGAGREYSWWLTQKFTDAYHVLGAFTPMFSYERSVSYPHGHRNCMFARRGVRTLPRLAQESGEKPVGGIHPDDTKMLYRYLKELGGICASHTSATGMGTDWRDNDNGVEPVVEIYQGDRMSYEMEGAPRAGYDPQSKKLPANVAGWYPRGFVNNALEKGYRLGFQASSDHWSTHISYFMVLIEEKTGRSDREAILDAIKKRHTYGATDNILVDVRSGSAMMGDELKTKVAPTLKIHVVGAADLAKVDILRDSKVVATLHPQGQSYTTTWTDPDPLPGAHYYYIRVLQRNNEIAWGSPLWIHYEK
jgi:hypothetical protein